MPIVYRGMLLAAGGVGPQVGDNTGNQLGVRDTDVHTYIQGMVPWVDPDYNAAPQGVSVAPGSPCNLPSHRRPPGPPWNGTGNRNLIVWELNTNTLVPANIAYAADPGNVNHGLITPGIAMTLAQYRTFVHGTAGNWQQAAAPVPACPAAAAAIDDAESESLVNGPDDLVELIDAAAGGADPSVLLERLQAANAQGVGASSIVSWLEAGVRRAEAAGDDDGAETLRTLLDRITGFSGPHARIELE